jgi:hypothetical protein
MLSIILLSFILISCGTENTTGGVSGVVTPAPMDEKEIDKKITELEPAMDADGKIRVKAPKGEFIIKASKLTETGLNLADKRPLLQHFSMKVYENTVDEGSEFILHEDADVSSRFLGFIGALNGKGALVPVVKIGPAITIKHEGKIRQHISLHIPYDKEEDNREWSYSSKGTKLALLHMVGSTVELLSVENGVDRTEDFTLAIGKEQLGTFQVVKYDGDIFWTEAKVDLSKPQEIPKSDHPAVYSPRPELPEFDLLGTLAASNKSWKTSCVQNYTNDTSSYSNLIITKTALEKSSFTFNSADCSGELKSKEVTSSAITVVSQTSNSIQMTLPSGDVTLSLLVSGFMIKSSDSVYTVYMESP